MDTTKIKYDEAYIISEYSKGRTAKAIAVELGTYNTTIRRILIRNNITLRGNGIDKRIVTSNPFLQEGADYWLGWIASDGNISTKGNKIRLNTNKDPEMLDEYIKFLGYPLNVGVSYNRKYDVNEYVVGFSNYEVKQYLISIGLTPNKSKTLVYKLPITIDFIRGILDGDGTVTKKGHVKLFTASKIFADQLQGFMSKYESVLSFYRGMYSVSVYKEPNLVNLYFDLYQNGGFCLDRKKRKFGLDDV